MIKVTVDFTKGIVMMDGDPCEFEIKADGEIDEPRAEPPCTSFSPYEHHLQHRISELEAERDELQEIFNKYKENPEWFPKALVDELHDRIAELEAELLRRNNRVSSLAFELDKANSIYRSAVDESYRYKAERDAAVEQVEVERGKKEAAIYKCNALQARIGRVVKTITPFAKQTFGCRSGNYAWMVDVLTGKDTA